MLTELLSKLLQTRCRYPHSSQSCTNTEILSWWLVFVQHFNINSENVQSPALLGFINLYSFRGLLSLRINLRTIQVSTKVFNNSWADTYVLVIVRNNFCPSGDTPAAKAVTNRLFSSIWFRTLVFSWNNNMVIIFRISIKIIGTLKNWASASLSTLREKLQNKNFLVFFYLLGWKEQTIQIRIQHIIL